MDGVVSSDYEYASKAGAQILAKGGNAVDAAVSTAFALSVIDPYNSGLGGFGVAIYYSSKEDRVYGLNFIGTAPSSINLDLFNKDKPWEDYRSNIDGALSVLVPGSVAGWGKLHEAFGSLKWIEIVKPAIELCRGFPVTPRLSRFYNQVRQRAGRFKYTEKQFYKAKPYPKEGEVFYQEELRNTLEIISREGWRSFYTGEIAKRIAEWSEREGGVLRLEDLASYEPQWTSTPNIEYNGYDIYSLPEGTSGITVLEWINILNELNSKEYSWDSPEFAHLFFEAGKLALRDDDLWNTGKDYIKVPVSRLLSRSYARELASRIKKGAQFYEIIGSNCYGSCTTSFSVADSSGNVISMTLTQMYGFDRVGFIHDLGFSLNNGICYFSLDRGDKERLEPKQRPRYPLNPIIAIKGKEVISLGAAGGWTIPQTVTLTGLKIIDYKMDIKNSISSPRYLMRYKSNSIPYPKGTVIEIEDGFPPNFIEEMRSRGHVIAEHTLIEKEGYNFFGVVNGVQILNGRKMGGADHRREGSVVIL
jgi:gamma-glutamyltranspeptidase/glutathione hydrolase